MEEYYGYENTQNMTILESRWPPFIIRNNLYTKAQMSNLRPGGHMWPLSYLALKMMLNVKYFFHLDFF